ncbi:FecR domain-containing protein (plasmid) [Erwinia sp. INIA-01]|uniref:FecR family protein n=1 Tax=Erwinia sp. INIA01 TaxID=2991500 RepID=UPI0022258D96|nr:FecR domain-containing protein [Erwinia sp. INIA01]MCW1872943.1 FecR domain-containing protein [Erwinia sp. INIA01]
MTTQDKQAVAEQAIRWLLRQQEGMTRAEQDAFQHWLQTPAHRAEYQDLSGLWQQTAAIPADAVNHLRPVPVRRRVWRPLAFGCALLMLAAVLWLPLRGEFAAPIYTASWQTGRGEMRTVDLPDGSKVSLDAGTQLTVRYYPGRREVEMPQGQAFFQVAHNPQQPFAVFSGPSRVTVVGTEFSVRYLPHTMSGDGTDVAVSSGAVRVGPRGRWQNGWWRAMQHLHLPQASAHLAVLHASERATGDAEGRLIARTTLPADSIAAWRDDRIVLDNTRLDMALAEFARYGDVSIKPGSSAVAALRVSGSFDTDRAGSFAKSLPLVLPVKIKTDKNQLTIVSSAAERKNN